MLLIITSNSDELFIGVVKTNNCTMSVWHI